MTKQCTKYHKVSLPLYRVRIHGGYEGMKSKACWVVKQRWNGPLLLQFQVEEYHLHIPLSLVLTVPRRKILEPTSLFRGRLGAPWRWMMGASASQGRFAEPYASLIYVAYQGIASITLFVSQVNLMSGRALSFRNILWSDFLNPAEAIKMKISIAFTKPRVLSYFIWEIAICFSPKVSFNLMWVVGWYLMGRFFQIVKCTVHGYLKTVSNTKLMFEGPLYHPVSEL